jgi:hypothetical protein
MTKARYAYQAVIRSALLYRAALRHRPSDTAKPKSIAAKLQKQQNQGLWTVLRAFKTTPIRQLETESHVPPLDLWLNGRIARFQARMECPEGQRCMQSHKRRNPTLYNSTEKSKGTTSCHNSRDWTQIMGRAVGKAGAWPVGLVSKETSAPGLGKEVARGEPKLRQIVRPGTDPGGHQVVPEDTPPTAQVLKLHDELRKAESALLKQACTKRIRLAKFLHRHEVLGFSTATCLCEVEPWHMALFCMYRANRRHYLHVGRNRTYTQMVGTKDRAKHFVHWMMYSGRLAQFSLAKRLLYNSK